MSARLVGLDFETTGTDVATCGVVQAAYVDAEYGAEGLVETRADVTLCNPECSIPKGASAVHGIYDEDVRHAAHFRSMSRKLLAFVCRPNSYLVTYNGMRFDVPVWERIARKRLAAPHVDVMRLHMLAKKRGDVFCTHVMSDWPASAFAGSLLAAHVFWCGETFDGAHDALVDVRATLGVLEAMLEQGFVGSIEEAAAISSQPLPGDVDMEGKFKWEDGEAVISFSEFRGTRLCEIETGFLRWMLKQDFPEDTKTIVAAALRGEYPKQEKN